MFFFSQNICVTQKTSWEKLSSLLPTKLFRKPPCVSMKASGKGLLILTYFCGRSGTCRMNQFLTLLCVSFPCWIYVTFIVLFDQYVGFDDRKSLPYLHAELHATANPGRFVAMEKLIQRWIKTKSVGLSFSVIWSFFCYLRIICFLIGICFELLLLLSWC